MKYYDREVVSGSANEEKLEDVVTSTAEEPKHVIALWFTETTGTENNDGILRAYVERERILNMSVKHFLNKHDADGRQFLTRIEVDVDLPVGQSLSVGCVSGGTASNFEVVAEYEITK